MLLQKNNSLFKYILDKNYVWIYILFKENTGMTLWQIVLMLHAALNMQATMDSLRETTLLFNHYLF